MHICLDCVNRRMSRNVHLVAVYYLDVEGLISHSEGH